MKSMMSRVISAWVGVVDSTATDGVTVDESAVDVLARLILDQLRVRGDLCLHLGVRSRK